MAKLTCHFSASENKRPEIWAIWCLERKNPGTFVLIRPKVASFTIFTSVHQQKKLVSYTQNGEIDSPLFGELEETSRDLSDLVFETKESWDVCPNSPESGKSILQFSQASTNKKK